MLLFELPFTSHDQKTNYEQMSGVKEILVGMCVKNQKGMDISHQTKRTARFLLPSMRILKEGGNKTNGFFFFFFAI